MDRSAIALAAVGFGALLWSSYCAFTHGLFGEMMDYIVYSNMMWNSAHGRFFEYFGGSYLRHHLSYLLIPLSLIYHAWDHPFVLSILQWALIAAGAFFTQRFARQSGMPAPWPGVMALYGVLHHFPQQVQLSEFHGVACYFVLYPLLSIGASKSRWWTILPLSAILAVREDAGLTAAPILAWYAYSRRWRGGWWMVMGAVVYTAAAIFVLYPMANGHSLFDRRTEAVGLSAITQTLHKEPLTGRLSTLAWILAPLIPFARRKNLLALALFIAPSAAITLGSGFSWQYRLWIHYPAPFAILTPLALIAIAALAPLKRWWSLWLVAVALVSHLALGYIPLGGRSGEAYSLPSPLGLDAVRFARNTDSDKDVLIVTRDLKSFAGNRRSVKLLQRTRDLRSANYFLASRSLLESDPEIRNALTRWKPIAISDYVVLLRRETNAPSQGSAFSLAEYVLPMPMTLTHHARNAWDGWPWSGRYARFWRGDESRWQAGLSHGGRIALPSGTYVATLEFRSEPPRPGKHAAERWGFFRIYPLDSEAPILAHADFPPTDSRVVRELSVTFSLEHAMVIEPRVVGGSASLWLYAVRIRRVTDVDALREARPLRKEASTT